MTISCCVRHLVGVVDEEDARLRRISGADIDQPPQFTGFDGPVGADSIAGSFPFADIAAVGPFGIIVRHRVRVVMFDIRETQRIFLTPHHGVHEVVGDADGDVGAGQEFRIVDAVGAPIAQFLLGFMDDRCIKSAMPRDVFVVDDTCVHVDFFR